ncbi:redoxin domain-containing protein [Pelagicoccus mobilis]|uniref:Redoxin domain-containing protein n=1 Tax=Pelagicoccus mobilis TaxID=415221 RepID=A0A934S268_9BACT|nr:redoxin domain-containing protein [Pelagicoccus mobilis]MBK1878487.1 redoxin domain-containing protein [Pelagicoccus mobilis]
MKILSILIFLTLAASNALGESAKAPLLSIGSPAPDFNLPGIDGKNHQLSDYDSSRLLAIVFTCNHCPTAQAYEQRLNELATAYSKEDLTLIAISPNDDKAVRLDELGYSEYNDSLEEMIERAKDAEFKFPYLYDGENQKVSWAYGAQVTPQVLIFDEERKLKFNGRIDDNDNPALAKSFETRDAIDALLAGKPVPVETTKVFGCSVKWSSKRENAAEFIERWNAEPSALSLLELDQLESLRKNDSENLRLINVWATWCGPCVAEFPDLVDIHRQYRGRSFETVTVSMDLPKTRSRVDAFLKAKAASMTNYLYNSTDRYALINALDGGEWDGALPYTLLVAPGGKVIYQAQGQFDPLQLKKAIVGHLGRTYFE